MHVPIYNEQSGHDAKKSARRWRERGPPNLLMDLVEQTAAGGSEMSAICWYFIW